MSRTYLSTTVVLEMIKNLPGLHYWQGSHGRGQRLLSLGGWEGVGSKDGDPKEEGTWAGDVGTERGWAWTGQGWWVEVPLGGE